MAKIKLEENTAFLSQQTEKVTKEPEKSPEHVVHTPKVNFITEELAKYDFPESIVAQWREEFIPLVVKDIKDEHTIAKATAAYKQVRDVRIGIEKKRKELKEGALNFGRAVDNEAKRLTALVEPIEAHLAEQKNFIDNEKDKIRVAKDEAQKLRMQERTNKLLSFGAVFDGENFTLKEGDEVLTLSALDAKMSDDQAFNILLLKMEILHEKSKIRIAAEQDAARIERERVERIKADQEAEAARLEAIRVEQEKAQAELKRQQNEVAEQKRELERQKQKEIEIAAAAEKAKITAEKNAEEEKKKALEAAEVKRIADIAAIKKAEEDKAAEDKAKKEAEERELVLRPDKQKIVDFANMLQGLKIPELTTDAGKALLKTIAAQHSAYSAWLYKKSETLK